MASNCIMLHSREYGIEAGQSASMNAFFRGGMVWNSEGKSNLEFFLDHVTPSVQCPAKVIHGDEALNGKWKNQGVEKEEGKPIFFNLGDLWGSFDEWSVYGAGVPLVLPCGETMMQYYVPYLSALQIYHTNKRIGYREDNDWSDGSDMRSVVSSDFGSDNESERAPMMKLQTKAETEQCWENLSSGSSDRLSFSASSDESECSRHGDLAFEYFERCSPYGRTPLAGKIRELAVDFPQLYTLMSNELSPASWLSVAWYPIYRIPTGPTMSDSPTCFLTFHSLWTPSSLPLQDKRAMSAVTMAASARGREDSGGDGKFSCYGKQRGLEGGGSEAGPGRWLEEHSPCPWRVKGHGRAVELPAFGLASYKLGPPFCSTASPSSSSDRLRVASLVGSANAWIRQLDVRHPDFDFFISRDGISTQQHFRVV